MNKENVEPKNNSLKLKTANTLSTNGKKSFENYLIQKKAVQSPSHLHFDKQNNNHTKKIKFIDELDKTKPVEEIVDVESFKKYNVDVSEEPISQNCNCNIF